ncbi:unnamed protein product [Bursaphelenchus okinawaensis]|uniref:Tartrate-resistant acid phosphatase type 5 n=1 Tax=Bursaphelenchus okinawaensis TaxID=465554 RepID=A0A811JV81_9BILA|nr:unnamed protein product [Bursaphelenchus okinawaensis]CAG9085497.1 unnamed protein product [Bursaphelenchus okinawaensis]
MVSTVNGVSLQDRLACTNGNVCRVNKDHLDFFVLGDTGGISFDVTSNYLNFIKATEAQQRLADSMADLAGRQKPDFIINVGDNVYFNGAETVFDSRFDTVFEEPYADPRLDVPWYMIAGNHDHLGNISAQIEYTKYSTKWTYPKLYYKASYSFADGTRTVDILFIDTIVLCGNCIDVNGRSLFSWIMHRKKIPNKPDPEWATEAVAQWKWIEEQLGSSRADYLFVVGHYPIYSISSHGPAKCLIDKLDPLLRKYHVSAYFAGHDHTIQFFRVDNTSSQSTARTYGVSQTTSKKDHEVFLGRPNYYKSDVSTMHYLISGAGSRTDFSTENWGSNPAEPIYHYPRDQDEPLWKRILHAPELGYGYGGFVRFEVRNDTADMYFYVKELDMEFLDYINRRPNIAAIKD